MDQEKVVVTQSTHRAFKYEKGPINLTFNLRTDIKDEAKVFKELLEMALADVETELAK